jgi:hypothetical protein
MIGNVIGNVGVKFCFHCHCPCEPRFCAGCKRVWYCEADCQKRDWRRHRWECTAELLKTVLPKRRLCVVVVSFLSHKSREYVAELLRSVLPERHLRDLVVSFLSRKTVGDSYGGVVR